MSRLQIPLNFKKLHQDAVLPAYAKPGDAGLDLTATEVKDKLNYYEVMFGVAVEIPEGYLGLIIPRSSITDMNMMLKNSVGLIDSTFRGELRGRFKKVKYENGDQGAYYKPGEKAAQLVILPYPEMMPRFIDELPESVRGEGGFGSTGK